MSERTASWSPWQMLRFLFRRVIADPVREGRLRDTGWPPGLRAVVVAGLVCFAVAVGMTVFAGPIRANLDIVLQLESTIPLAALPVILVFLLFALACLFTAALHMVLWVRIPVVITTIAVVAQGVDTADGWQGIDFIPLACAVALVALAAIRWRGRFVWWEFVAALIIVSVAIVGPMTVMAADTVPAVRPLLMFSSAVGVFSFLWMLAVPVAFLAGAAMAELTASTVTWAVTTVWQGLNAWRRRILPFGMALIVILLLAWAARIIWEAAQGDLDHHWSVLLAGAGYGVLPFVLCGVVARRADRVPDGDLAARPDPDDIPAAWSGTAPILAILFAVGILGDTFIGMILQAFGVVEITEYVLSIIDNPVASTVRSLLTAVVVFGWAWWLSGRGRRIAPMGLAAFAGLLATDVTFSRLGVTWSYQGLLTGIALAAAVILVGLLVTRRLTADRGLALLTVLLLVTAFEYREVVFEPITALIGLAGVGSALLVGLVWRLLTDNGYTQGDSARFPQPGRVLIALANVIFGVSVIALDALMGGAWIGDLGPFEGAGDRYLGVSMFLTVMYAGLSLAMRGRSVASSPSDDDAPPPVDEGNRFPTVPGDELWHTGWQR